VTGRDASPATARTSPRIRVLRGTTEGLLERLAAVRADGDVPLVGDDRWPVAQWEAVRARAAAGPVPDGTAWATLTSGTSGSPRIVLRTAASWEHSFAAVSALLTGPEPPDEPGEQRILLPSPAASSLTLFSLAHALAGGPRPTTISSPDAAAATLFHGTPQALRTLLARGDAPELRTALVGGSHLDAGLRVEAEARSIRVVSYYGAAELSFVGVDTGHGLRAFPGVELAVRDGELWVRSPFTALATLQGTPGSASPLRTDGDWATVGDLASLEDGTLTVHGRADGAILTASATVIPEEVEAALREIPGIADAIVVGLPRVGIGALVAAVIEPAPGADPPTARALKDRAEERFAPSHRPRLWFHGALPRTVTGKPARAEVLRRLRAGEVERCG
jgi:acyl-CoA synthetase (AMP-forming)/AMP-acid ligase II